MLVLVWKKHPLALSWLVVVACVFLLSLSPTVLQSSLILLILFLCYTLLPMQLGPSALAALLISLISLALRFLVDGDQRKVSISTTPIIPDSLTSGTSCVYIGNLAMVEIGAVRTMADLGESDRMCRVLSDGARTAENVSRNQV